MISKKDYNEIYLKGHEEAKKIEQIYPLNNESDEFRVLSDKINEIIDKINNLKIHYEIKPSFTTRKLKQLQKENNQLKTNWNKLKEYLNYQSERAVGEDEYVYDEIYNEMQELEKSDE